MAQETIKRRKRKRGSEMSMKELQQLEFLNGVQAARYCGISPRTFYYYLKQIDIQKYTRTTMSNGEKILYRRNELDEKLRPILRGRDIKRYGYNWANLWLINIHNGIKGKLPRIDINEYPAIKVHLDQYWNKIKDRMDQGDTPYNLRNCAYMEDFYRQKIVWGEISDRSKFAFDNNGIFVPEATTFLMIGEHLPYLLCILNSPLSEWFFSKIGTTTGVGTVRWKKFTIQELIIPKVSPQDEVFFTQKVKDLVNKTIDLKDFTHSVNKHLYSIVGLSNEEESYVENFYPPLL